MKATTPSMCAANNLAWVEYGLIRVVESVLSGKKQHHIRRDRKDALNTVISREKRRKERWLQALALKREGKTYCEVGKILGVSGQQASNLVRFGVRLERLRLERGLKLE